jgi:hypothetical protein
VRSTAYSLQENCQIHALAQYFGVCIIFHDEESALLKRVMGEDTSLETLRTASCLTSMFRWRALVERCRCLPGIGLRQVEEDLKTTNCGGLNTLATKLDELPQYMAMSK